MREKLGSAGWSVALFLSGLLVSGAVAGARGDWLGREAAREVKVDLNVRIDREISQLQKDVDEIKKKLDRLIELQKR